jgi:hypothetical protein
LDKEYLENLVFKLNQRLDSLKPELKNSSSPVKNRIEPSQACSKFSTETIISILQSFLFGLATQKGTERNLFAKRFIKEIIYSGENIKIILFYSENFKNFSVGKSSARQVAGGAEIPSESEENLIFSNETEFVSETQSARGGI